jgi:hypothetical protein
LRTDSPTDMVRTGPLLKSLDWLLIKGGLWNEGTHFAGSQNM